MKNSLSVLKLVGKEKAGNVGEGGFKFETEDIIMPPKMDHPATERLFGLSTLQMKFHLFFEQEGLPSGIEAQGNTEARSTQVDRTGVDLYRGRIILIQERPTGQHQCGLEGRPSNVLPWKQSSFHDTPSLSPRIMAASDLLQKGCLLFYNKKN